MKNWADEYDSAITVCDAEGIIIYMNAKSMKTFEKYGAGNLIGTSIYDCHPPHACEKIRELMQTHGKNVYTIEKNGIKKMIYQAPYFEDGIFKGLVEISHELPLEMPHFIRK